ncbi:hypothetical protein [Flavobacterium microcysteis]|uniref:Uncharacterized protein n=1 Tax=Flavobacterium microcysteis TaxID=2596891 RepID=A0A501Q5F4_9FLAO|nr:hypothetical protein [Flavobacterium microcysteis]TPD67246.1 hypothetical protein FJA49_13300 [Flavobacterium microcysteis]
MEPTYNNSEEDLHLDQGSPNPNSLRMGNDKRGIDNPNLNRDNNNPHDKDRDFDDDEEDDDDFLDDGFDDDDSLTDDEEADDDPQDTKRNQKRTGTNTNPK